MSIYHRRVYLKPKKNPPIWMTKELPIQQRQSQSTQTNSQNQANITPANSLNKLKKQVDCKTKLSNFSTSQIYTIFMSILTIYTIFAIDIDKAFFNVQASTYFSSIHCTAILLFIGEILLLSFTKEGYVGKFYFWIDCFSTLTMFLQLIWIENLMSASSDVTVAISFAKVTKASRLSKIGARSSKIMKLIRLVKLMKFLDKQEKKDQKKNDQIVMEEEVAGNNQFQNNQQQQDELNIQIKKQIHHQIEEEEENQSSTSSNLKGKSQAKMIQMVRNKIKKSQNPYGEKGQEEQENEGKEDDGQFEQNEQIQQPEQQQRSQEQGVYRQNRSEITFLELKKNKRKGTKNQSQNDGEQEQMHQSRLQIPSHSNFNNISHHTSHLSNFNSKQEPIPQKQQSDQGHQVFSEDQKNNIEELMKMFFAQNLNRFIEEGKNISARSHKKEYHKESRMKDENRIVIPTAQSSSLLPQQIRRQRNSSRLSFVRRKQLMDLSRNRQFKQKGSRFNPNYVVQAPFSNIVQKLEKSLYLPPINRSKVDPKKKQMIQNKYQQLVEKLRQQNEPKKVLSAQNLKVGQVLKQQIQKNIVIMVMGLIMILPIITADTWFDQDSSLSMTANIFIEDFNNLPLDQGRTQLLQSFIKTGAQMSTPLQYFNIPINQTCCQFPQDFPDYYPDSLVPLDYLRLSQQTVVIDGNITIIFSKRSSSQITSYLNLGRSFFITLLLIFCSVLFMKDIQNYALNPLEKMSSLINQISNNPFEALKQINKQKNQKEGDGEDDEKKALLNRVQDEQDQKLQTNILSDVIIKITSLLTIGAGQIGSEIISKNIQQVGQQKSLNNTYDQGNQAVNNNTKGRISSTGQSQIGIYVYIQFRNFQTVCDIFGDQIFKYINKVTQIIHTSAIELGGVPIEYDGKGYLLLWKPKQEKGNGGYQTSRSKKEMSNGNGNGGYGNGSGNGNGAGVYGNGTSIYGNDNCNINPNPNPNPNTNSNHYNTNIHNTRSAKNNSLNDSSQTNRSEQNATLAKLAILAINSLTKIILQLNSLQQSRRFYQYMMQKYSNQYPNSIQEQGFQGFQSSQIFNQNYQPHLFISSIHVGYSFYGSIGSQYKLQCKCIGYDIAFTRYLATLLQHPSLSQEKYNLSNLVSEDIYALLQQYEGIPRRLNIRKIDQLKIKQIRFRDILHNQSINYMSNELLKDIKCEKSTLTQIYTFDFIGKLQCFNNNQSQLMNNLNNLNNLNSNQLIVNGLRSNVNNNNNSNSNNNNRNSGNSGIVEVNTGENNFNSSGNNNNGNNGNNGNNNGSGGKLILNLNLNHNQHQPQPQPNNRNNRNFLPQQSDNNTNHNNHHQNQHGPNDTKSRKSELNQHNNNNKHNKTSSRIHSFSDFDNDNSRNEKALLAYSERDKWLGLAQTDSIYQLCSKLQSSFKQIVEARRAFDNQFYQNWADSLQCYYSKDFSEALNQFRFLHTYNQSYYDYPSKLFILRIQNINLEEIELEKNRLETEEVQSEDSSQCYYNDNQNQKKKWNGIKEVIWKL